MEVDRGALPPGWRWVRVGELSERVSVGYVSSTRAHFCRPGEGVPLVRSQNIRPGRLVMDNIAWVTQAFHDANPKSQLQPGDVLITRVGANAGDVCIVPNGTGELHLSSAVFVRPKQAHRKYIELFFRSPLGQHVLKSRIVGSVSERINTRDVEALSVLLPSTAEEASIAHILGTLDEKIELNRRMNESLEVMARALFKSWFVDFDPVRAKAEGCDPGLPKHIADLFPDSFEDSAFGEIPRGWRVKPLDEIAHFLNGLAFQKYPPTGERSLPVIKIAQLRAGSTVGADRASANLNPAYVVQNGDVLFSWSGSLECVLWAGGTGVLNQHLFKVTSADHPRWLCYLAIHRHLDDFRHIAASKATTMGHIQRHHLSDAALPVPPHELVQAMDEQLSPIVESLWKRNVESYTLAELRDTLLPKLISGAVRTSDISELS